MTDLFDLKRLLEQALSEISDGSPDKAETLIEQALANVVGQITTNHN